jgi:hypothetical protein
MLVCAINGVQLHAQPPKLEDHPLSVVCDLRYIAYIEAVSSIRNLTTTMVTRNHHVCRKDFLMTRGEQIVCFKTYT